MKHFYHGGRSFFLDDSAGSQIGLMSMIIIQIISYHLCSHLISTQLNTCGRFWTEVLDSTFIIKTPN